jgi:CheY-like chemotaxis protein
MNILIVDDDPFLQKSLSFHLMEAGHNLSLAPNGQKALEMLEKNRNIDVIVCDVNMPVLTGPSLILTLKKYFPAKLPVIIIVSGIKEGKEFLNKIEIQFDYYFEKPVDHNKFIKTLEEVQLTRIKV